MVKTAKFTKDSPEWEFFAEFYKICEKYYEPINDIAYWSNFYKDCNEITAKMRKKSPQAHKLAVDLLDGYLKYLNEIWSEKKEEWNK